jgi:hypothetical protein
VSVSPFARQASDQQGEDFELPPPGLQPATMVALVDMGTQDDEFDGKPIERKTIYLAWELMTKDVDGDPFLIGEAFTDSFSKKAKYRKLIEGWRGKSFADGETFDPFVLLGLKCVLSLTAGLSKAGKKFVNITSVATPMQGQAIPDPVHQPFFFHLSTWNDPNGNPIPDWMPRTYGKLVFDVIKKSHEWLRLSGHATPQKTNGNGNGRVQDRHEPVAQTVATMAGTQADKVPF